MNDCSPLTRASSRNMCGALAYLAMHMENACPRSACLAALLLNRVASDSDNDAQLRLQAQVLADLIEGCGGPYVPYARDAGCVQRGFAARTKPGVCPPVPAPLPLPPSQHTRATENTWKP
ncbi:MAG: hypothetical protein LBQ62_08425 [Candidatus Accumulibacter sp.]|nr:hypothetical protein [Accumulibacter sp.]